jgi:hypothetical protein
MFFNTELELTKAQAEYQLLINPQELEEGEITEHPKPIT